MIKNHTKRSMILIMLVGLLPIILGLGLSEVLQAQVNFLTHHLDNARTGWNSNETQLTPTTVKGLQKLWETEDLRIQGQIYGAPLVYTMPNGEERVFFATEQNFIYALNARNGDIIYEHLIGQLEGRPERPLTQFEWDSKLSGNCIDLNKPTGGGPHGVTGAPVIDPDTNTMYLVNLTLENDIQVYKAHAIHVEDGSEVEGWPVTIRGNFGGRPFEAYRNIQRSPLNLVELKDGKKFLYITFAARCDAFDWHGWVFGINVNAPQQGAPYVFNTTPDGNGGGIWGPGGISIDPDRKHGYIATGNGTTNWMMGGNSYAMSVLRLDLTNREQPFSRAAEDFLTISNWAPANSRDDDLGGSSPLVIPDQEPGTKTPRLLITAGKDGRVYLMNRDHLDGLDGQLQKMRITSGNRCAPTYFKDNAGRQFIYITGTNEPTFPSYGTFIDWEEDSRYLAAQEKDRPRAALGTGPTLVEFGGQLFMAWVNFALANPEDRSVRIKSSPDGIDWSSPAVAVGGQAAVRTSPALTVFQGKLFISWIDDKTNQIMVNSSANGMVWDPANTQMLGEVAPFTYTSMAEFRGNLYIAFITGPNSDAPFSLRMTFTGDGKTWSTIPIELKARQKVPVSAPFIIPFVDEKDNPVLYAFWLKDRDDRTILFKRSGDGVTWPMEDRSLTVADNERANRESGLSGLVMRTIIDGSAEAVGPPRLFILFLTDNPTAGQQNTIFAKSINTLGVIEAADIQLVSGNTGLYFSTRESGFAGTKVGATNFRGNPVFVFVERGNRGNRFLRFKPGAPGYRGGGLVALQLTVDPKTGESRFFPAWTSGRPQGADPSVNPQSYDYLPGSAFVSSNGGQDGLVWVFEGDPGNSPNIPQARTPATLHAYDPATGEELFNSNRNPNTRVDFGGRKFAESPVVNGRVFIVGNTSDNPTSRNGIAAYGLRLE